MNRLSGSTRRTWIQCSVTVAMSRCNSLSKPKPIISRLTPLKKLEDSDQEKPGIGLRRYFASQGAGIHLLPFGSSLKFVLVMKGCWRYIGSSTMVVMINQESPFVSLVRL